MEVVCINMTPRNGEKTNLTLGKIYISSGEEITVVNDVGETKTYPKNRFMSLKKWEKLKPSLVNA